MATRDRKTDSDHVRLHFQKSVANEEWEALHGLISNCIKSTLRRFDRRVSEELKGEFYLKSLIVFAKLKRILTEQGERAAWAYLSTTLQRHALDWWKKEQREWRLRPLDGGHPQEEMEDTETWIEMCLEVARNRFNKRDQRMIEYRVKTKRQGTRVRPGEIKLRFGCCPATFYNKIRDWEDMCMMELDSYPHRLDPIDEFNKELDELTQNPSIQAAKRIIEMSKKWEARGAKGATALASGIACSMYEFSSFYNPKYWAGQKKLLHPYRNGESRDMLKRFFDHADLQTEETKSGTNYEMGCGGYDENTTTLYRSYFTSDERDHLQIKTLLPGWLSACDKMLLDGERWGKFVSSCLITQFHIGLVRGDETALESLEPAVKHYQDKGYRQVARDLGAVDKDHFGICAEEAWKHVFSLQRLG